MAHACREAIDGTRMPGGHQWHMHAERPSMRDLVSGFGNTSDVEASCMSRLLHTGRRGLASNGYVCKRNEILDS